MYHGKEPGSFEVSVKTENEGAWGDTSPERILHLQLLTLCPRHCLLCAVKEPEIILTLVGIVYLYLYDV
jgi:hypothetical protein